MSASPLVSILIPAYNERHFPEAFRSALVQRHPSLEIVVCDDSPGTAIEAVVAGAKDGRVRYLRNPARLGFAANFARCFEEARGELIKFLNDDDRLRPHCVESLAGALANESVVLATSRRQVIDDAGQPLPDVPASTPISHVSALLAGRELGNFVLVNSMNLIGEPTTVMFRRSAFVPEAGALFRWDGRDYHCLADVSVWLRLLSRGLAYYGAGALSEFRVHGGQEQRKEGVRLSCLTEWLGLVRSARSLGFLAPPTLHRAALSSVRMRVEAWKREPGIDGLTRQVLAGFERELEAEIALAHEPAASENH